MTCGITVAPMMPTAISRASPSKLGEKRSSAMFPGSGVTLSSSKANATTITPTKTAITAPQPSGIPNRRLSPRAAPSTSARSVAIAITSAWIHSPKLTGRERLSRHTSARFRPVAIPSFADSVWTSMAMRFAASTAQSRR
jgi:hypothetical protein